MTRKRRTKNLPPSAGRRREGEGQREGEDQDRWRSTRNEAGSSFLSPEVFIAEMNFVLQILVHLFCETSASQKNWKTEGER